MKTIYLRSIYLRNTGPVTNIEWDLSFVDERPIPIVIVGPNGSGKSTIFSFIVNAIISFKQRIYEGVEVEKNRVYRLRSGLAIRGGESYYHSLVKFDNNASLEEWQLDRTRKKFENDLGWTPLHKTWNDIPEYEDSHFSQDMGQLTASHELQTVLDTNCLLFFPSGRFEPPDWLNTENLSTELKLPEPTRIKGKTDRRIFARNRLKPTMEWIASLMFDALLHEHFDQSINVSNIDGKTELVTGRLPKYGPASGALNAVTNILKEILIDDPSHELRLHLSDRRSRIVSATISSSGKLVKIIRDLLGLSAGESALFCLFASIIMDADQAGISFSNPNELKGIVLIDEADLHLHLDLQYRVLPKLITLFPNIQFIISAHSPLVVLGMDALLGQGGFVVREMPQGEYISAENYTEFLHSFELHTKTKKFRDTLLSDAIAKAKPILLFEGKTDAELISIAWAKLNPGLEQPFTAIGCGSETGSGGAKNVNNALRYLTSLFDKKVIAIFDNDREGAPQFAGLKAPDFISGIDSNHKRHSSKDVHAILLPIPAGRENFVQLSYPNRILEIEHYFPDSLLEANGMKGGACISRNYSF
jgi:hypothetical protein